MNPRVLVSTITAATLKVDDLAPGATRPSTDQPTNHAGSTAILRSAELYACCHIADTTLIKFSSISGAVRWNYGFLVKGEI